MPDEVDVPTFVEAILSHAPAWCCLSVGFGVASLIHSRAAVRFYRGDDTQTVRDDFVELLTRAQAAVMARDQEALAKVALEAYSDNTRNGIFDMVPQDQFAAYFDNLHDEIKALKKENDGD